MATMEGVEMDAHRAPLTSDVRGHVDTDRAIFGC